MLNPTMLAECKDIIFNKSNLPETVKEPVHQAISNLILLEYGHKDFLSRELVGEEVRGNVATAIITAHGGDHKPLIDWFMQYESPAEGTEAPAWEG